MQDFLCLCILLNNGPLRNGLWAFHGGEFFGIGYRYFCNDGGMPEMRSACFCFMGRDGTGHG